jgi:hypothetical protein
MINEQLTPKEWQMLSAYLDGQLGQRERRVLEAQLNTNSDLRQGLEEMRRTRLLLRSAPRRKAPRNFTVSRAMADQYRPARLPAWKAYPAFRLASALASILLIVTFLGDFALATRLKSAAPAASTMMEASGPAASEQAGAAAPQEDTTAADPGLNAMSQPAGPLPNDTPAPELQMAVPMPTLNPTEEIIQRMTNAPLGMGGGLPEATPADGARSMVPATTATPDPFLSTGPSMKASAETPPYPAPLAAAAPTATATLQVPAAADRAGYPPAYGEEAGRQAFNFQSLFRPAEIFLAIIAVLTGIGALILRRR